MIEAIVLLFEHLETVNEQYCPAFRNNWATWSQVSNSFLFYFELSI